MASDAKRLRMRTLRQAGPTPDIGGSAPARRLRCKRCACNKAGVYLTSAPSPCDYNRPNPNARSQSEAFYESSGRRAASGDRSWDSDFCRQRSQK
jgi:hypothetical protein